MRMSASARSVGVAGCLAAVLWGVGCEKNESVKQAPTGPIHVVVSIPPLAGLVKPLVEAAGGTVSVVVPPGAMEHGYEIPPDRLSEIARADMVVYVGMGLEPALEQYLRGSARPGRVDVCFAEVIGLVDSTGAPVDDEGDGESGGGEHGGHEHDQHLWLDPDKADQLVSAAGLILTDMWSSSSKVEEVGARISSASGPIIEQIREVDEEYRKFFGCPPKGFDAAAAPDRTIIVQHDAYSYLASRYGLNIVALSGPHAEESAPDAMAAAVEEMRKRGIGSIFVEPQEPEGAAARLAKDLRLDVYSLDPLGTGDWGAMMLANLNSLKGGLKKVEVFQCRSVPFGGAEQGSGRGAREDRSNAGAPESSGGAPRP